MYTLKSLGNIRSTLLRPQRRLFCQQEKQNPVTKMHQKLWTALLADQVKLNEVEAGVTLLELPKNVTWSLCHPTSSPFLFARQSTKELFNIAGGLADGSPGKGFTLIGNPGIGKSWFLQYLLYKLAKFKKAVCWESASENVAWLFTPNGNVRAFRTTSLLSFPHEVLTGEAFYLFDPAGYNPHEPTKLPAFTVVPASPDVHHYYEHHNRVAKKLYMPPWTKEEVEAVIPYLGIDKETVMEHFCIYGGIPRYIFRQEDSWRQELNQAIATVKLDDLHRSANGPEVSNVNHMLLHYHAVAPYTQATVSFASDHVTAEVSKQVAEQKKVAGDE